MKTEEAIAWRGVRRNPVAKAVRTSQFRTRVVPDFKKYDRARSNRSWTQEV